MSREPGTRAIDEDSRLAEPGGIHMVSPAQVYAERGDPRVRFCAKGLMSQFPLAVRPDGMNARFERLVLLALALSAAFVGLWALLAPASFYAGFPGAARHWVAVDGPFNEHLVRDVGALNCALCVLSLVALLRPERAVVRATGLTWLIFAVPHLAYHAHHLGLYNRTDQVLNLVSLGGVVVLAATLVLPKREVGSAPTTVPLPGTPVVDSTGETL